MSAVTEERIKAMESSIISIQKQIKETKEKLKESEDRLKILTDLYNSPVEFEIRKRIKGGFL
jgi:archaellum component FlaC